jgi:pimeloyl-ACP methyl ester carboxylesterase
MELEIISEKPQGNPKPTPILFVHGAWHGAWCWKPHFLPYFAEKGYHAFAVSLRGHGDSGMEKSLRTTRIADYVEDVSRAVARMPGTPILVGHSMGGLVVQKYLENQNAPAGVLLASVPVKGAIGVTLKILRHHPLVFLRANLTLSLYPIIGSLLRCREAFFSEDIDAEKLERYFRLLQDESYFAFLDMLFNLPKPKKVTTDLLVLGAENDFIFGTGEVEATATAYGVKPSIIEGMAHDIMLEDRWQMAADRILEWLAGKGL